ncbi:MAG TPA: hypothetical protein VK842_04245, partial [bacterium]|nr:hypothetical protein [bacterium]
MRVNLLLAFGLAMGLPLAAPADDLAVSGTAASSASSGVTAASASSGTAAPLGSVGTAALSAARATPAPTFTPSATATPTLPPVPTFTPTPSDTPDLDANDDADIIADAVGGPAAAALTGTASGAYHLVKRVHLPGDKGWDYCLADSDARRLYVTHGDQVVVLDLDSAKVVGRVGGLQGIHGVALAKDLGRGYISDGKAGAVVCFDLRSDVVVTSIPARPDVDCVVYEPATQQVFAFSGDDQSCTVIDAASNKVVATLDLGGKPEFAAVD